MLATGVASSRSHRPDPLPQDQEARVIVRIERLQRQLVNVQKRGDLIEESRLCNNIAVLFEEIADWKRALEFHHYDCQISEAAGDFEGFGMALANMSRVLINLDLVDLAKACYNKQLSLGEQSKDLAQISQSYMNIASLLISEVDTPIHGDIVRMPEIISDEKLAQAESFLVKSYEMIDKLEGLINEGLQLKERMDEVLRLRLEDTLLDVKLKILRGQGPALDVAEGKVISAREQFKRKNDDAKVFESLGLLARIFETRNKFQAAIEECYDAQLALARSSGQEKLEQTALFNLARSYRCLNDYELSLQTFYLYKDLLTTFGAPSDFLLAAEEEIAATIELKQYAENLEHLEAHSQHSWRELMKMANLCKRLELWSDGWKYVREATEICMAEESLNVSVLKLAVEFAIKAKARDPAIFFACKLTEYLDEIEEAEYLILNFDSHYIDSSTVPDEILRAIRALVEGKSLNPKTLMQLQSRLAQGYRACGNFDEYHRFRDECLSLWEATRLSHQTKQADKVEKELEALDYFADRKASKNFMKLLDGNFNMKSRAKSGARGMKLRRGLLSEKRNQPSMANRTTTCTKRLRRRPQTRQSVSDDGKDCDENELGEFINDEHDYSDAYSFHGINLEISPPRWPESLEQQRWRSSSAQGSNVVKSDDSWETKSNLISRSVIRPQTLFRDSTIASAIRVTVQVDDATFIIPVIDDIAERKTISWLIGETTNRYEQELGKRPLIDFLQTKEGARLSGADPISLLLNDGQLICAHVQGFRQKALVSYYRDCCRERDCPLNSLIEGLLIEAEDAKIDLGTLGHDVSQEDVSMIVASIGRFVGLGGLVDDIYALHLSFSFELRQLRLDCLVVLDLSFSDIGDCGWIGLNFPNLKSINLSWCQLENLRGLFKYWISKSAPLECLKLAGCNDYCLTDLGNLYLLPTLRELDLSYGHINELMIAALSKLLKCSSSMQILRLRGCTLEEKDDFDITARLAEGLASSPTLLLVDMKGTLDINRLPLLPTRCQLQA